MKVVKNKLAPPFQIAEFDIRYGTGIDSVGDVLDQAVAAGAVSKSGAYYSYEGATLGQGRERTRQALLDNATLLDRMRRMATDGVAKAKPEGGSAKAA